MQPPRPCRGSSRRSSSARWPWSAAKKPPPRSWRTGCSAPSTPQKKNGRHPGPRERRQPPNHRRPPIKPPGCVVENIRVDLQDANTHLRFLLPYIHCGIDTETY